MTEKQLKFVKGELAQGKPANIYFYDDVDYWDVRPTRRPTSVCANTI